MLIEAAMIEIGVEDRAHPREAGSVIRHPAHKTN
jgi:hypothetical protein